MNWPGCMLLAILLGFICKLNAQTQVSVWKNENTIKNAASLNHFDDGKEADYKTDSILLDTTTCFSYLKEDSTWSKRVLNPFVLSRSLEKDSILCFTRKTGTGGYNQP